ncbi:YAP-binding/ALF4/Glomulin [Diplogelasinospora grovesii]|uniref:YAP-binding/ALF4/Glomulin n=1 Tax=Diplogelasinospora grovesii TaxID=303347 RepID=A0AAN6NGT5_9PEZI|nr:YAP-binding/ALF4/Glomulin [Diplogelasinospora grovesii]
MADVSKAIEALKEARPPATDKFTYLTIIEANLIPEVLPTLNEILQDAELTQELGWDLIYNLVNMPESEACLETIARLGNPREVILKVLETLEILDSDDGYQSDDEGDKKPESDPTATPTLEQKFITLLGMLAILHKRIKTKYPSRFLAQTLQTILRVYRPEQQMTASVINLVHSLSIRKRPTLPTRKSSVNVANPDQDGDAYKNAPDPEADRDGKDEEDPSEGAIQQKMLLSFVTCVLEAYVNGNDVAWAARLLEFYNPERMVPGKQTLMAAFRENQELQARDSIVGQLVALTKDLGPLEPKLLVHQLCNGTINSDPLRDVDEIPNPDDIPLSTGGCTCLVAYWVFSSTLFDADEPTPDMHVFPEHFAILDKFLQDDAEGQINRSLGTIQALVAIGLWLQANDRISSAPNSSATKNTAAVDDPTSDYMAYLHLLTLIAVYHPQLHVRNAASSLAGLVLHADPADDDRLRILYDLLENCMFASLKACAITWLREELIAAAPKEANGTKPPANIFAGPQALETVQYVVFPSMAFLKELDAPQELVDYLVDQSQFLVQAVNFGLFLWTSADKWKHVLPANLDATVKERWFEPLRDAISKLDVKQGGSDEYGQLDFDVSVLRERMALLEQAVGFRASEGSEKA